MSPRCRASTGSSSWPSEDCCARCRRMPASACSWPWTARRRLDSRIRHCSTRPSCSTSTIITTTPASARSNLVVADASSTAEVLADVFAELGVALTPEIAEALYAGLVTDTGRFQYANTTPKALRLAADLLEAGADIQRIFQGVYESMEFAKLKLLARALDRAKLYHEGHVVVSYLLRDRLRRGGGGRAVLRGDHRRAPRRRGRRARGADPGAAARGQPRAEGVAALVRRPGRRVGDRPPVGRWRAPAGGRLLERPARSPRSPTSSSPRTPASRPCRPEAARAAMPIPKALEPTGMILVDKPAGPSSFAVLAGVRSRTGAKTGHAGTLDPFATGLLAPVVRKGNYDGVMLRRAPQALPHGRRPLGGGRRPAIPRASASSRANRLRATELEAALEGLRGDIELPIPAASAVKIGGERAYRLHRRGVAVEMPMRRSQRRRARRHRVYRRHRHPRHCASAPGTYVRSIADALGGHCVDAAANGSRAVLRRRGGSRADRRRSTRRSARIGLTLAEAEEQRRSKARRRPGGGRRGSDRARTRRA